MTSSQHPNRDLIGWGTLFVVLYVLPWGSPGVSTAVLEGFALLAEYAREHVLLCLIPAFFIAGAIAVFLNQAAVIRYLGPRSPKILAYGVASVSGSVLSVCSCTVLPLFKGIYRRGAGLGPAVSFLYSGPAISVLAMVFTFRVFGWQLGLARLVGSVVFALVLGLVMGVLFRSDEVRREADGRGFEGGDSERPLWQTVFHLGALLGALVFLNWPSSQGVSPVWDAIHQSRFWIGGGFAALAGLTAWRFFERYERQAWLASTRDFALQIVPLLFVGVWVAGFLLGRPGHVGLIPQEWVTALVGGNSFWSNLAAALSGALMYFATLTEVPIVEGLLGNGMGQGPALALFLAGPSLSLPSLLVIHGELGWRKTLTYAGLVVALSTLAGWLYGLVVG